MLALAGLAVAMRIVSLIPSLTEDLFAIGAGPQVVAVSSFTSYPSAATRLPVVSSLTSIDVERIVALHPDLVVGVSAQRALAAEARKAGLRVELIPDDTLADLFGDIERLGALSGHAAGARRLERALRARQAAVLAGVRRGPAGPRVFVVLDTAPIYTVGRGSYIDTLLRLAGARNAAGDVGEPYPRFSEEALVARQPDALVVSHRIDTGALRTRSPWSALRAVRAGRVWTIPEDEALTVPGPRYVEALAWLVARVRTAP